MYHHKEGICLQKVSKDHLEFLLKLKQDNWWGTHNTLFINYENQIKWFDNLSSNELFLLAVHDGSWVGVTCYTEIDYVSRTLNISGAVDKEFRKEQTSTRTRVSEAVFQGGTDFAFEILNMYRLNAEVIESHYSSLKMELDYLGFQYEGRKRKAVYKCGKYYDSIVLGSLRS